jgi:hypothetical protein
VKNEEKALPVKREEKASNSGDKGGKFIASEEGREGLK